MNRVCARSPPDKSIGGCDRSRPLRRLQRPHAQPPDLPTMIDLVGEHVKPLVVVVDGTILESRAFGKPDVLTLPKLSKRALADGIQPAQIEGEVRSANLPARPIA